MAHPRKIAQGETLFLVYQLTDGRQRVNDIDDTGEIRVIEVISCTAGTGIGTACDTVVQKRACQRRCRVSAAHLRQPQHTTDVRCDDLRDDGFEQRQEFVPRVKIVKRKIDIMCQIGILLHTAPAGTERLQNADGIGLLLFIKDIFKCLAQVDIRCRDEDIGGGNGRDFNAGGMDILPRVLRRHTCIQQSALNDTVVEDGRTCVALCDDLHAQTQQILGHILGIADRHRRIDESRGTDGLNAHIGQLIPDGFSRAIHTADHQRCRPGIVKFVVLEV